MTLAANGQTAIIRTERGLTIAGTRITLYDVMDYVTAQYPPKFIRGIFNLTDAQIDAALAYIEAPGREAAWEKLQQQKAKLQAKLNSQACKSDDSTNSQSADEGRSFTRAGFTGGEYTNLVSSYHARRC